MNVFVDWNKCKAGTWCALVELDLNHEHFDEMQGVYIIWSGEINPVTFRVGQGYIRDRLGKERNHIDMNGTIGKHKIYVTWAKIDQTFCNGVVRYIAEALEPLFRSPYPDVAPIEVNLPAPLCDESFPWE